MNTHYAFDSLTNRYENLSMAEPLPIWSAPDMQPDTGLPIDYEHEDRSLAMLEGELAAALTYWRSLVDGAELPSWDDFNLLVLPLRLIPFTHVFDRVDDGGDYMCRYWGAGLAEVMDQEMTGKRIGELSPSHAFGTIGRDDIDKTVRLKRPRASATYLNHSSGRILFQTLLRLPLSGISGRTDHCVSIALFEPDTFQVRKFFDQLNVASAA